jgi:hypothetical protein
LEELEELDNLSNETIFPKTASISNDSFSKLQGQKGLLFLHANIRSLIPKILEVKLLLEKTKAAVLAISETWVDSSVPDGKLNIEGYNILRRNCSRHSGGVCLYIKHGLAFNLRPDLNTDGLEAIFTEILLPKSKPIIIGACYHPPNDNQFLPQFETVLSKIQPDI